MNIRMINCRDTADCILAARAGFKYTQDRSIIPRIDWKLIEFENGDAFQVWKPSLNNITVKRL